MSVWMKDLIQNWGLVNSIHYGKEACSWLTFYHYPFIGLQLSAISLAVR